MNSTFYKKTRLFHTCHSLAKIPHLLVTTYLSLRHLSEIIMLLEAVHLNNQGVSMWTTQTAIAEYGTNVVDLEEAMIRSFSGSLVAIQQDILRLSLETKESTAAVCAVKDAVCFRSHPIESFSYSSPASQQRIFVFHRAFEATIATLADSGKSSHPGMNDAIACSTAAIFNMSLVHHWKYLRYGRDEDGCKAEELYHLACEALESCNSSSPVPSISTWIQLGTLNNLGAIKLCRGDKEGAMISFLELLRLLNMLETGSKASDSSAVLSLLEETERDGMTSNCLSTLFQLQRDEKFALAA